MSLIANINDAYNRVLYLADKSGYNGYISPDDFNLNWKAAENYKFKQHYDKYPSDRKSSTSLSVFTKLVQITIPGNGQYTKPNDLVFVDSIYSGTNEVTRVEKDRWANFLNSSYDPPTTQFPIYTEYATYLQFAPTNLASASLNYLGMTNSSWGYVLAGSLLTLGALSGGTGYTNGSYTNVPLVGGIGQNATANITVASGVITSVTIVSPGVGYLVGDLLAATGLGPGTGFNVAVATISVNTRPVYSPANSVQPLWLSVDLDEIVMDCLRRIGVNTGDQQIVQFANDSIKLGD